MNSYNFEAVDAAGLPTRGTMEVGSFNEALRRIKEMGLFPTRVVDVRPPPRSKPVVAAARPRRGLIRPWRLRLLERRRVNAAALAAVTRQLATLVEAGMPLLRGLRILHQQENRGPLKDILARLTADIENGSALSEALALHPQAFNPLYVNMVKAGEMGGALDVTLRRLAEFVEKAQRIKGKVRSAMFYPAAVLIVAGLILVLLTTFVIPRFKEVFAGLVPGAQLPAFTSFVLGISDAVRHHLLLSMLASFGVGVAAAAALRTTWGRWTFDRLKLSLPAVGPVIRKTSISRFARTLGTLLGNGVPILPALTIVRETAGNVVVSRVVSAVQDSVKEGETVAAPLRASGVFPPVICGMVDVGEQTGALPDMLMKIADGCDDEVDNAVNAMTSLLEPILIIFLAVVVGSIVIALFLPILTLINSDGMGLPDGADS
jgi:type IV pilus assembly protein PilC